jgi:hypothetical protein
MRIQKRNIYIPPFPKIIMERKRPVRKCGNSFVISLWKADIKDFELKEGDMVNIEEIVRSPNLKNGK